MAFLDTLVLAILNDAGLNRQRTPYQVHLACASGYSRPVVESHIASILSRGAGHVRYKGLAGAVLQQGMTVLAHNGAVMVRIRRQQVSKRAQKFRRLLGLKLPKVNEINPQKTSDHYLTLMVRTLANKVQEATGDRVEVVFVDQGDTGEHVTRDAQAHYMHLEVVKLPEAKQGFVVLL